MDTSQRISTIRCCITNRTEAYKRQREDGKEFATEDVTNALNGFCSVEF